LATNQGVGSSNLSGRAILTMKKIIILLSLSIILNISFAKDIVKGIGISKCLTFNNSEAEEKIVYISWMAGYITSHNILKKSVHANNISYDRTQIWLEYYCFKNPNKNFKDAVSNYINEFTKN
jgi:hypothetical protein